MMVIFKRVLFLSHVTSEIVEDEKGLSEDQNVTIRKLSIICDVAELSSSNRLEVFKKQT